MEPLKIEYYGHACFRISYKESAVVLDPYADGSVPGLKLPEGIEADAVYCSHGHADHNAAEKITLTGKKSQFTVSFVDVAHDHHNGAKRGRCKVTFLQAGDIKIAHFGDLGCLPDEELTQQLKIADVWLMPCAGYFTIDAKEARQILENKKHPGLTVLMHYRDGDKGYGVQQSIEDIQREIPGIKRLAQTSVTVEAGQIPDEIITLEPVQ